MTRFCQLQRLNAWNELACAEKNSEDSRKKWIKIEGPSYNAILRCAQSKDPRLRAYYDWPHPENALVLPNQVREVSLINCGGGGGYPRGSRTMCLPLS
jgi:hypothetical protein